MNYRNKIYQIVFDKTNYHHLRKREIDVIETLDGEIRLEYLGEDIKFREYNNTPARLPELQIIAKELDLEKAKTQAPQAYRKRCKEFSKVVEIRGYFEREELLTEEEKRKAQLRVEERKREARKENIEMLNEHISHEEAL